MGIKYMYHKISILSMKTDFFKGRWGRRKTKNFCIIAEVLLVGDTGFEPSKHSNP